MKLKTQKILLSIIFINSIKCIESTITTAIKNKYCKFSADYIVIGAGTAGALMLNMLSNDFNNSVIGLHSGENLTQDNLIKFSQFAFLTVTSSFLGTTPLYLTGLTVPQINADNRLLLWLLALPLGGASSINAGAYSKETNFINSQWQAIAGPNWSVDIILKLYKQLETYNGITTNPAVHGYNGPLQIRQSNPTIIGQKFAQAVTLATGFPTVLDINDPNTPIGPTTQVQYTQTGPNGIFRESSATTFLNSNAITSSGQGVNGRKLQIFFNTAATRAIWSGNTVIGVEYIQDGIVKQAMAKKGVIVCAGLKSSNFLMLSGIGPKSLLDNLGIPVKFNNPNVGQNLADQPNILLFFKTNPNDTIIPNPQPNNIFQQITYLPDPTGDQNIRKLRFSTVNLSPGVALCLFDLIQPLSRGSITIASNNPLQSSIINMGVLSNNEDLALYLRGMKIYINNINTAIKALDPDYELIYPDPAILTNDVLLTEFIRENIRSNQHFQSQCRMAPLDQGGVVDSFGKVYGVNNLYVADDSIVPQDMDGSPMASAYLMAYNVSRLILGK